MTRFIAKQIEIAAGNSDLANRTTRQAASLERAATSMEELTSTVSHNADNARQVRDLSVTTAETTEKPANWLRILPAP